MSGASKANNPDTHPACIVEHCPKIPRYGKMCEMHRARLKRHGDVHYEGKVPRYPLSHREVLRLRRLVGIPESGLTPEELEALESETS